MIDQVFENYESAILAIEQISEESALPSEDWRRLESRSFAWSSPGIVTITDTVKTRERHGYGYRDYNTYNYSVQVKFEILPDEVKTQLQSSQPPEPQPIIFIGKAIIKTPTQTIEITPPEVEWVTEIGCDNNVMGADIQHTGVYCFDKEGVITWTVYEFLETTVLGGDVGYKASLKVEAKGAELVTDFASWRVDPDAVYDHTADSSD
jgi:hypothetical protein